MVKPASLAKLDRNIRESDHDKVVRYLRSSGSEIEEALGYTEKGHYEDTWAAVDSARSLLKLAQAVLDDLLP